jgi:hypothetical protein
MITKVNLLIEDGDLAMVTGLLRFNIVSKWIW